ncbi:MAG: MBL fold metallo-hydrolase [Anaerolineaceae bacterium]
MSLSTYSVVVGASQNNVVFLVDESTLNSVVIDPSFNPSLVVEMVRNRGWILGQVWLTHGHFDHTAGAAAVCRAFEPQLPIRMSQEAYDYAVSKPLAIPPQLPVEDLPELGLAIKHGDRLSIDSEG